MTTCRLFRYTVVGSGSFPLDMLRYDGCWPGDADAVSEITKDWREVARAGGLRTVRLVSHRPPTEARWRSFSWLVQDTTGTYDSWATLPKGERL